MGFWKRLVGGRGRDRKIMELMNPVLGWRQIHFVAFPRNEDGYVRHYFQYLDKENCSNEFIVFHHETIGGLEQQHTVYRKAPEEAFVLLNQNGPWSMTIGHLADIGRTNPSNTQPTEGHHVLGVSVGNRGNGAARGAEEMKPNLPYQRERVSSPSAPDQGHDEPDLYGFEIGVEAGARVEEPKKVLTQRQGFKTNQFVVYPPHGVGQILAIEEQEIAGAKLELFVINFIKDKMTLRVPTAKAANVGMRKLSSLEQVDQTFDILKLQSGRRDQTWSMVAEEYEAKINSGDIAAIAEVVRDLNRSESQPEQPYSERQLYEAALDRLSREIAVVQHVTETEALEEVTSALSRRPRAASLTPPSDVGEADPSEIGTEECALKNDRNGSEARQKFALQGPGDDASLHKAKPRTDHPPSSISGDRSRAGVSVSWTDWEVEDKTCDFDEQAKRNIRRTYNFLGINSPKGAAKLTIECALEVTAMPDGESVSIDRKLRFYLRPFCLPHEAAFVMRLATRDGSLGGEFDIVAGPAEEDDEGAVITKFGGRNDVTTCITTLRAGRDIVFGLRDDRESLVSFLLPNDDKFQPLYDETIQHLQQRTAMDQALRYNAEPQRKQDPRPDPMKVGRTDLAIVIFPQEKGDGTFGVRLMAIFDSGDIAGEIDWNGDDFLVARKATLDSAIMYSKGLSNILGLKVLQLQKS